MAIVRWRPMRDLMNVQDEMNRVFDRFFGSNWNEEQGVTEGSLWAPIVDLTENKEEITVQAEIPGLKKDEIHINYKDGVLTMEGERRQVRDEKDVNYHRVERSYGKFSRSFRLPVAIQEGKISADYKDGVLTIHLPKSEEAKPKEIEIKVN